MIGHDPVKSQTFLPEIIYSKEDGLSYADIAGFEDTGGDLIELFNCFMDKHLI